jgi:hypothetical protein
MSTSSTFRSLFAEPGDGAVDLHGFFSEKSEPAYISPVCIANDGDYPSW